MNDDPLIGSPKAIRGGTLNVAIGAYPLTFRLMGPNTTISSLLGTGRSRNHFALVGSIPSRTNSFP